jgi:hypothetical protein
MTRLSIVLVPVAVLCSCLHLNAQFTTVINVPPDIAPSTVGSGAQLNVLDGGSIADGLTALDGSEVNFLGGVVSVPLTASAGSTINLSGGLVTSSGNSGFTAMAGSTVNVTAGELLARFYSEPGSTVNLSGGVVARSFAATYGTNFRISGGEFRYNGAPVAGLDTIGSSLQLLVNGLLSGTFADGTPFAFTPTDDDFQFTGSVTLEAAPLPLVAPLMAQVPGNAPPLGIRDGQTLTVASGGTLGAYFNVGWGSTLNVVGGHVGNQMEAVGANVNMSSGAIGSGFNAYARTTVNVSGGVLGERFRAERGSVVNISGGRIGRGLTTDSGSTLNLSGGTGFQSIFASTVIYGTVNLTGGDFRLNGVPISGLGTVSSTKSITVLATSTLSGTFADGTPFSFAPYAGDGFNNITPISLHVSALPPVGATLINAPLDAVPLGIRVGQTLIVNDGSNVGDNFNAGWGSTVLVQGGTIGDDFEATGADVTIKGGFAGPEFNVFNGSVVKFSGGTIGGTLSNAIGYHVLGLFNGSTMFMTGGTIDGPVFVSDGGTMNIAGGTIGHSFGASSNATVHLFGRDFVLDGVDMKSALTENSAAVISKRDVVLSGVLADGSPFTLDLRSTNNVSGHDYFNPASNLTVTLVLPGDYNSDGVVDAADYTVWRDALGKSVAIGSGADGNFDGWVNDADYVIWRTDFGARAGSGSGAATAIPEPATSLLLIWAAVGWCARRRFAGS